LRPAAVPATGGTPRSPRTASTRFQLWAWNDDGIYFSGMQRTSSHLFRIDPKTARITRISSPDALMSTSFSLTRDGRQVAFVSASPTSLYEVYVAGLPGFASRVLTKSSEQAQAFVLGTREVISWKSQDGRVIEATDCPPTSILRRKRTALRHHGGLSDEPVPAPDTYYPADIGTRALIPG
jgi:dipeptidyl aminopeptidase/acylaminoacyl peptidase